MRPNLPNILSALRLPLAALFPVVHGVPARLAIVVFAAVTDWVDGRLARARGQVTRTGELLDPIADKAFVITVLATLVVEGRVPLWAALLILVRDIGVLVGSGVLALAGGVRPVKARAAGKLVTWLQFSGLGTLLAWPDAAPWIAPPIAIAGLAALRDYARAQVRG